MFVNHPLHQAHYPSSFWPASLTGKKEQTGRQLEFFLALTRTDHLIINKVSDPNLHIYNPHPKTWPIIMVLQRGHIFDYKKMSTEHRHEKQLNTSLPPLSLSLFILKKVKTISIRYDPLSNRVDSTVQRQLIRKRNEGQDVPPHSPHLPWIWSLGASHRDCR